MPRIDIEKRREYGREYYKKNRKHILEVKRIYTQSHKDKIYRRTVSNRNKIQQIKMDKGCVDCGYNVHFAALDFDHVQGSKAKVVSDMVGYRWDKVMLEIEKCEVRCANCHRIKTHNERYT